MVTHFIIFAKRRARKEAFDLKTYIFFQTFIDTSNKRHLTYFHSTISWVEEESKEIDQGVIKEI